MTDRFIAFDVETPNSANDRMSAIGITVLEDGAITEEFYSLVDPETDFDYFNTVLTGIDEDKVRGAPTFPELWPRLVLGHNGVRLSKEEGDRILAWMNMNVPFFGTWSETGQPDPEIIKRRRQLAKQVANDDFDPEKVVNPYTKAAFEKPDASAAAAEPKTGAKPTIMQTTISHAVAFLIIVFINTLLLFFFLFSNS